MSDELLKESLHHAAAGEPPAGDAFARFGAARRRAAVVRAVTMTVVVAAILASFSLVLPNPFRSGAPTEFVPGGVRSPDREITERVYTDSVARYRIAVPVAFEARGDEGARVVFFAQADPPIEPGDPYTDLYDDAGELEIPRTFYVQVTPDVPANRPLGRTEDRVGLDALEDRGARVERDVVLPAFEGQLREPGLAVTYPREPSGGMPAYWCRGCATREFRVALEGGAVLFIRVVAPDEPTMTLYDGVVGRIVDSLATHARRG
ncbi:MAG TPA: hypothetical protein VGB83_11640 [Actinomycetota bacterium]